MKKPLLFLSMAVAAFTLMMGGFSASATTRTVLLEQFTTMGCSNCPSGHTTIKNALSGRTDVIWVCHHSGYYTDAFTTALDRDLVWMYNAGGSTYAPAWMVNRTNMSSLTGVTYGSPVMSVGSSSEISSYVDKCKSVPTNVEVSQSNIYNPYTRELAINVDVKASGTIPSNAKINVWLVEDGLVAKQAGYGDNYVHNNVFRQSLTTSWGQPFTLTNGEYKNEFKCIVPDAYKLENLKAVVFVANYDSTNPNACDVLNATEGQLVADENATPPEVGGDGEEYVFTYVNDGANFVGKGGGNVGGATHTVAIKMSASKAASLDGNSISKIGMYIGNYTTGDEVTVIIAKDPEKKTYLYSQKAKVTQLSWNTVTLDTPYKIKANEEIYIGYVVTSGANDFPVGVEATNGGNGSTDGDIIVMDYDLGYGPSSLLMHTSNQGLGNVAVKAYVAGGNVDVNDVTLTGAKLANYYCKTGSSITFNGTVVNHCAGALLGFNVNYQLDGNDVVTSPQTCTVIANGQKDFSINIPVATDGDHAIRVWVSEPNGMADSNIYDNDWYGGCISYTTAKQRNVLVQQFTTQYNGYGCQANEWLNSAASALGDRMVRVDHHAGWDYDNFTTDDDIAYEWFYNDRGTLVVPAIMVDRTYFNFSTDAKGPLALTNVDITTPWIKAGAQVPAFLEVKPEHEINADTREITVRVNVESMFDLRNEPFKVNVYVLENKIEDEQQDWVNGKNWLDYDHNYVFRKSLTGTWGRDLDWYAETSTWPKFSAKLDDNINLDNVSVVAFVSFYDRSDANACQVLNSAYSTLVEELGVDSVKGSAVSVIGGNGCITVSGDYAKMEVYGIDGRLVKQATSGCHVEVPAGLYIAVVDGVSHKVLVK